MASSKLAIFLSIGALAGAAPEVAYAQTDLRLSATVTGAIVTQTRSQTLSFVATNDGDAPATNIIATSAFAFPGNDLGLVATCPISISGPINSQTVTWSVGELAVGELRICNVTLRGLASATSSSRFFALRLAADQADPIPGNNIAGALFVVSNFDAISDLSVSVSKTPPTGLVPTDGSGRLFITLTNAGPNAAATAQAVSDYYDSPFQNTHPFVIFGVPGDPCSTQINVELGVTRVITGPLAGLAAGASITCVVGIERRVGANDGTYVLGWTTFLAGFGSDDPNPSNNAAAIPLGISIAPAPVSALSPWAVWALAAFVVLVGLSQLRRSGPSAG